MTEQNCEICAFNNPKVTVTAIIIKDNKLLLLKRNKDPFKGKWDLPGGFLNQNEQPSDGLKRELKEELNIEVTSLNFINTFPGNYTWKERTVPVSDHFYLTDIQGDIKLDDENSESQFVNLKDISIEDIAFENSKEMIKYLQKDFAFDLNRVKELVAQLDPSAVVKEQSIYKAILDGFIAKKYDGEKLIGMGWVFPRQTLLRRQAVVEDMIVDPEYRGKGYGEEILLQLLEWAKKEGMNTVELTTNPQRLAANSLYQKVGFKIHPTNHYLYFINE